MHKTCFTKKTQWHRTRAPAHVLARLTLDTPYTDSLTPAQRRGVANLESFVELNCGLHDLDQIVRNGQ